MGRIISGGAVFGNISRLMTRYCSISVASTQDWDSKFYLDQYCVRELYFWEANLKQLNCRVVSDSPYRMSNYVLYSDASATGCGALTQILMASKFVISNGIWKNVEEVLHGGSYLPYCSLYIRFYPYL